MFAVFGLSKISGIVILVGAFIYIEFRSFLGTKTRVVNYAGLADGLIFCAASRN